jgi:hypothetical protein
MLFLVILVYVSYADPPRWQMEQLVNDSKQMMFENEREQRRPVNMYDGKEEVIRESYYQLLLKDWLKDANEKELGLIESDWRRIMRSNEVFDSLYEILERSYNIEKKSLADDNAGWGGGEQRHVGRTYPFWLAQCTRLPNNEQIWMLFSTVSRRAVSHKDKKENPDWKNVNLPELRDNNAYTLLLRKSKLSKNIYNSLCRFPQKYGIFPNGVDSVKAINIATKAVENCCKIKVTPIAAKRIGPHKEHWMVYCFETIQDNVEQQEDAYKIFTYRYKKGFHILDIATNPCYNLNDKQDGHYLSRFVLVITVLISKNTGQVLFMD